MVAAAHRAPRGSRGSSFSSGSSRRSRLATLVGVVLGLALTATLVVRTTQAVFSGYVSTPANTWSTGGAVISTDATASAVFGQPTDGTLTGGQTLTRCLVITYVGATGPAAVKLYGTASGALAPYLTVTVDQGSGTSGNAGSCTGFTASTSNIYNGTLSNFAATANSYATGVGSWSAAVGTTMTYRFTVSVQNVAAAQNTSASAVFTWEAQA